MRDSGTAVPAPAATPAPASAAHLRDLSDAVDRDPLATVEGCVAALARGEVTAVELVRRGLDRISRFDGPDGLNAVVTVAPDALREARAADARRARGEARGPLDGVPYTVKDSIESAGLRTTHGSTLFEHWVPAEDAPVVARLRAAGMVLLAKVSLDDFAGASWGECSLTGWMRNPHDPTRTVGGSSGGSAVAVAAGYAPLSLGTDTGGSLRIPAALCGVATLRPTAGLLPLVGVFPRSPSQDVVGPMTSSAAGLALVLDVLAGTDGAPEAVPPLRGLRLGVVEGGLATEGDDPDGPVLRRFRALVAALTAGGTRVVPLAAPPRDLLGGGSVISVEASRAIDAYLARPGMPVGSFRALLDAAEDVDHLGRPTMTDAVRTGLRYEDVPLPAPDVVESRYARRRALREHTHELLRSHRLDAILYPSAQRVACPVGEEQTGVHTRWSEHSGLPAVGVPIGTAPPGALPWSIELLGAAGGDARLLAVARAVARAVEGADPASTERPAG